MFSTRTYSQSQDLEQSHLRTILSSFIGPKETHTTMLPSPAGRRVLQTIPSHTSSPPVLHRTVPTRSRPFSTTQPCSSQIGRAPLSIPPEVTFQLLNIPVTSSPSSPSPVTAKGKASPAARARSPPSAVRDRKETLPKVLIKGPLGELSMDLPAFLNIKHDEKGRKAVVSVGDRKERAQRAMWGMCTHLFFHVEVLHAWREAD